MLTESEFHQLTLRSMSEFEEYAGRHSCEFEPTFPEIRKLQILFARWEVRNFGFQDGYRPLLGIGEEVCDELEEAREDGDFSPEGMEKTARLIKDAAADAGIFMMNMHTTYRLDFCTILDLAETCPMQAHWAPRGVGMMNHALLKFEQGIRGMDRSSALERIVKGSFYVLAGLSDLCNVRQAIIDTAPEVLARDWTKNRKNGGQ